MGALYFFVLFMAQGSPLLVWFHKASYIVFGELGTPAFFALSLIFGLLVLFKWHLMRLLTKQYLIMLVLVSAILNLPIVDDAKISFFKMGGYMSRPIFRILDRTLGANPTAIKAMVIAMFLIMIVWIFYKFNIPVPLPRVNLSMPKQAESWKLKAKSDTGKTSEPSGWLFQWMREMLFGSAKGNELRVKNSEFRVNTREEAIEEKTSVWPAVRGSLIKTVMKSTLTKSLDDKMHQKTMAHISFPKDKPTFALSLLRGTAPWVKHDVDEQMLVEKAEMIQSKLMEFDVPVTIDGFDIGPSIIQIRVKPEAGIKISTIENLKDDIAMSTKVKALRIIAPIPGTDCVGIQIPRPHPVMVHLSDVLGSPDFAQSMQKSLTNLTLGKAIDGTNVIKSLEEMPHLLIAGATGSGKSVGVNDFILSLMYQNSPSELKFLMVDPKQVELEMYAGLPYLLAPIVTQSDKALKLLQRAVQEMEERYTKLSKNRVKKLSEYNAKFPDEQLYRIVFVIDELADLMMSGNKKEVETCITRIAQKARAVGIHLIVATQRPSVNVITWLIKANIPTRIAFGVVSQIDSRTILGIKGAEDLLGRGDLLYMDPTTKYPFRVQAPYVDTDEIDKVITSLKKSYMGGLSEDDIYHPEIIRILEAKGEYAGWLMSGWGEGDGSDEAIIAQAIDVIIETCKASATLLQRKLNLGFARAARVMDELERRGVVWPQDGARPRDILI